MSEEELLALMAAIISSRITASPSTRACELLAAVRVHAEQHEGKDDTDACYDPKLVAKWAHERQARKAAADDDGEDDE